MPEKEKIDVVMLTKNSEKPILDMCLKSIYANVPLNRLIIVDGYSSDDSIRIARSYPRVSVVQMEGSRGAAREKGIREVETEWFAFIDSDVVLCRNWYRNIKRHITDKTGAVWGVAIPIAPSDRKRCLAISKFYRRSLEDTMLIEGNRRGMLHDTIMRTRLMKNIRIPSHLHVWEDQYLKQKVTNEGFTWDCSKIAHCYHYANLAIRNVRDLIEFGKLARAYGYYSWRRILLFGTLGLPKAVWIYALTRDFGVSKWQLDAYRMMIVGWLTNGVKRKLD